MDKYKLYAKLDNTIIIELKMSWQLNDTTDYTEILETDNRHKANEYLINNMDGIYLLEFIDNKIVNRDITKELEAIEKEKEYQEKLNNITKTDIGMIRCIDDILNNIIDGTEIPQEAKDKLKERKDLRELLIKE